jgi:GntR family transcriptional repressor for pyruvate dehydrogenase complex
VTAQPLPHLAETVLRPVRGHHAFEACVEQVATAIRLGVYPLGTTLETRRGRGGGSVVTMKPQGPSARTVDNTTAAQRADWLDALDYRRIVEPGAAALAASAPVDDRARAGLEAAHVAVARATSRARHRQADSRFHLTIAAMSGSSRVVEAVTSVQASLHEMLSAIPVLRTNITHSDAQHAALARAVLAGHAERARQTMEEHCDDTAALLRGLLG